LLICLVCSNSNWCFFMRSIQKQLCCWTLPEVVWQCAGAVTAVHRLAITAAGLAQCIRIHRHGARWKIFCYWKRNWERRRSEIRNWLKEERYLWSCFPSGCCLRWLHQSICERSSPSCRKRKNIQLSDTCMNFLWVGVSTRMILSARLTYLRVSTLTRLCFLSGARSGKRRAPLNLEVVELPWGAFCRRLNNFFSWRIRCW